MLGESYTKSLEALNRQCPIAAKNSAAPCRGGGTACVLAVSSAKTSAALSEWHAYGRLTLAALEPLLPAGTLTYVLQRLGKCSRFRDAAQTLEPALPMILCAWFAAARSLGLEQLLMLLAVFVNDPQITPSPRDTVHTPRLHLEVMILLGSVNFVGSPHRLDRTDRAMALDLPGCSIKPVRS